MRVPRSDGTDEETVSRRTGPRHGLTRGRLCVLEELVLDAVRQRQREVLPGALAQQQEFDQHDGEKDRERIVAAGFHLERGAHPRPQAQAAGMDLPSSVAPFILRGVSLLGIESVMCPIELRKIAWARLAKDLDHGKLAEITQEIGLDQVIEAGGKILGGQVRGRIVVKIL